MDAILAGIQAQALARLIRITDHAREEMEAIAAGQIIENYPDHRLFPPFWINWPETIERLEALRQTTAPPIRTVPLYQFAGPASA